MGFSVFEGRATKQPSIENSKIKSEIRLVIGGLLEIIRLRSINLKRIKLKFQRNFGKV